MVKTFSSRSGAFLVQRSVTLSEEDLGRPSSSTWVKPFRPVVTTTRVSPSQWPAE